MFSAHQRRQLLGLALLALALFTVLSLIPLGPLGGRASQLFAQGNIMGPLGALLERWGFGLLGVGLVLMPALLAVGGAISFAWLESATGIRWAAFFTGLILLIPAAAGVLFPGSGVGAGALPPSAAGWVGTTLSLPLLALLGRFGAVLFLLVLFAGLSIATVGWNPASAVARHGGAAGRALASYARQLRAGPAPRSKEEEAGSAGPVASSPAVVAPSAPDFEHPPNSAAQVNGRSKRRSKPKARATVLEDAGDPTASELPPHTLLSEPPARVGSLSESELDHLGEVLVRTLRTFKVEGTVVGRTTGPVVTQFEVVPAPGVKVNRIASLDADLALALRAPSIRIVAPIPGKGAVGVEVPNPEPEVVYLRHILDSGTFQRGRGQMPLALGKDLNGRPYVADLARMPHLLIAGATGSGKSICINTLITSLIYKHSPRTLRFLMIDPKMVELSMYGALPHLRHPVVTDPHDAATVLKWAVLEMEYRYTLLKENNARSVAEFNRRWKDGQTLRKPVPPGQDGTEQKWEYSDGPVPYVVVVVEELADLMMTVQAEIEKPLARLAQKARAIGIHLIVATQRPSVNVITGLIKANFPCRIAFRVSSKVDSRTIIDQNGADALLGNGDMLFLPPGHSDPVRIQGAYLSTEDTDHLMGWYRDAEAVQPTGEEDILETVRALEAAEGESEEVEAFSDERDKLFRQAAEVCIRFQQGSTSLLQRKLRIGYGRAARIIDQLHQAGVLGPPDGSKPREVLLGLESLDHVSGEDS